MSSDPFASIWFAVVMCGIGVLIVGGIIRDRMHKN